MNATKPITMTTLQPAGAVFHRCALQVNPHPDGDAPSRAAAIVAKAVELGVSVLVVSGPSGIAAFRTAAAGQGITLFPGFELTSAEGIHVLCIYPPDADEGQLERFLGQLGIDPSAPSSDPSSMPFENVLTRLRVQGGVAIAAHATPDGGLFDSLSTQAWRSEDLLAVRIPGPIEELPEDTRRILENRDADYRRVHPAGDKQAVAVVNAKDVTIAADLEHPDATCRIKMSEVSIEGLAAGVSGPGLAHPPQSSGRRIGGRGAHRIDEPCVGGGLSGRRQHLAEPQPQRPGRRPRRRQVNDHRKPALRAGPWTPLAKRRARPTKASCATCCAAAPRSRCACAVIARRRANT